MNLVECIHTDSRCFKCFQLANPIGIVVHSTGSNNPWLKRYVQPSKSASNRQELLEIIGTNKYGNHWNRDITKAVHYMIGKLSNGNVATAKTLPTNISAWGVGKGKNGSFNYDPTAHIQFEILEDGLNDKVYFTKVYKEAVELCAQICKLHGWDESVIVSHKECADRGYGSKHKDPEHWFTKFGKSMNDFRKDVRKVMDGHSIDEENYIIHTVVKGDSLWNIAKKYLGSGFKYTEIKKLNGLTSNKIYSGQKLKIPPKK